jgi:hypothetical protein
MATRLTILMSSGSKKGTRIYVSLKNPGRRTPPGSTSGSLWGQIAVYRAFCITLENLINIPLNKKAVNKILSLHVPQKQGPY